MIDPPLKEGDDVGEFIASHLLLNLRQISDCLGRSEDDVIVLLHQVVNAFKIFFFADIGELSLA
jgi:hypothetical protein